MEENNDYTYTYSGRESLIRSEIVFVAKQGENDLFIEPGEHKYPFNITLPTHLPTSLEHVYGTIRYLIKATIDMPRYPSFILLHLTFFRIVSIRNSTQSLLN